MVWGGADEGDVGFWGEGVAVAEEGDQGAFSAGGGFGGVWFGVLFVVVVVVRVLVVFVVVFFPAACEARGFGVAGGAVSVVKG